MPTVTTNYYRKQSAFKEVSLSADTFAVALMGQLVTSSTEAELKQLSTYSEISAYEVASSTYSAMSLSADTVSANSSDVVLWDGVNLTWTNVTVSPYGLAIYRISDGLVVGFIEFDDAPIIAVNGTISLNWNANGIMNIF
ncbi:MAG: hypothetical protein PHF86_13125 [Candidatus Nanoarchaeia archaeon]|nr:hypothetical protein [Candidatus Nanoarchaeia archaeon]